MLARGPQRLGGDPLSAGPQLRSAVWWADDAVAIIDQTALPAVERVLHLRSVEEIVGAIGRLAVRGAPALGVTGALAVALVARSVETPAALAAAVEPVAAARPTAVNLRWGVERVLAAAARTGSPAELRALALREALAVLEEDRAACEAIGAHGRAELARAGSLLTVCNAGRLATAGLGSALAPIYAKARAGEPVSVFACETRPLLQGARLTAWELAAAGVPVTVVTEGAAPSLLAAGRVDAVIAGADRIAANGDTANKVGTYGLALAAARHGVPFYIAAPRSTLDAGTASGAQIAVEERDGDEVREASGLSSAVAVWNPAFDVTPAELIAGIVTEVGVLRPPYDASIAAALAT